ncbi:MAG: efflux RND transporter permease subunit [Nitrospirota bacterium]
MWLMLGAMRRPITVLVAVVAIALCCALALTRMPIDIFPELGLPAIYVAQPYSGMDPSQMEGYLVSFYEYHFLYITGIEHVESKSVQGAALIKLFFHPGTDMNQALAQTVAYVNRSWAFMPPGTVPPFIVRFDAGSVPVGSLIFRSETRSLGEIQDLALFRVRPMFATLPGVSAPPPFGGNARTIVVHVDPERMRAYRMSPEEVVQAVNKGNVVAPAGNVRIGDLTTIASVNAVIPSVREFGDLPIRAGAGATVYLRDIGYVENGTDILTSYALVNGHRAVYIPVTKRADASTLAVVNRVKEAIPRFQSLVPEDIAISFEFDQSVFIKNAVRSLVTEGALGAVLTGLMVLLFLREWRSALIVLLTIPFALLSAVVALWAVGQTINVMTLGGLALAVGVLVDESTVAIENIHVHLARGQAPARAALDAGREVLVPRLVAMLSVLAVFIPSFFMVGVGKALFVPLALAVGFAMAASYLLASTFVPVLATWLLRHEHGAAPSEGRLSFASFQAAYGRLLRTLLVWRWPVVGAYLVASGLVIVWLSGRMGMELFPAVDTGQFQLRLRAPDGTRIERTEVLARQVLEAIKAEAGPENVSISQGFVGVQPASYPVNTIHLWTSGPHEAVLLVALKPDSGIAVEELKERLRRKLPALIPGTRYSFEAGDIVGQAMSMGSPTAIEVAISGPKLEANRAYAERLMQELGQIQTLRDLQYGQPLDYPTVEVSVDRVRAGQLGVNMADVARALVSATSSSRFVQPIFWRDPTSGNAYQVQIEIPQFQMASLEDVQNIPAMPTGALRPLIQDVAHVAQGTMIGEYARYNMQRMMTVTANVAGEDLGRAARRVEAAIARLGQPPRGVTVTVRGQVAPMRQTLDGLKAGLGLAIAVIFLLLAANFQSLRDALVVLSTMPAVLVGILVALLLTHTTLNVQSFLGAIMATGVAVANAILLVSFAETRRREDLPAPEAAVEGAKGRLRPILMTSMAMIAGMVPMAMAIGTGGEQTAPLGRAVIGGLLAATVATLTVLPLVFTLIKGRASAFSPSLDPDDPQSAYHDEPGRPSAVEGAAES